MPSPSSLAATREEYNSSDGEIIPQTRRQANVIVKRSDTFDMGNKKPAVAPDTANDAGSSSLSASAMSSADSGQKSDSASVMVGLAPGRISSRSSPEKPLANSGSVSRKSREREEPECTVPNCQCGKSQNRRPPALSSLFSRLELNFPPFDQRSGRPPYSPPSPMSARQPPSYIQGSAVI